MRKGETNSNKEGSEGRDKIDKSEKGRNIGNIKVDWKDKLFIRKRGGTKEKDEGTMEKKTGSA